MRRYLHRKRARLLQHVSIAEGLPSLDLRAPLPASVEAVIPDGTNVWPITPDLARLLARLVAAHAGDVLELGAGSSSRVIARTLALKGGGRLTSIEQSPEWCAGAWAEVKKTRIDAEMIVAAPKPTISRLGVHHAFDAAIARRGPFDLVLIDAPQSYFGRDGALPLVYEHLQPGALIVLDDAGRQMEQWTLFRWLRSYPRSLKLRVFDPDFGGRGLAILEFTGERGRHFDLLSFLTGCAHAVTLLRDRRRQKR